MVVVVSEVGSRVLTMVRTSVVAYLISRSDFGLAATFALTASAVDLTSDLGIRQLVVQSEHGDDVRLMRTAHAWNLVRGVVLAVLLLLAAPVVARLFEADEAVWAFRVLAIVPLAKGLNHLDAVRFNRRMRFGPSALDMFSGEVAATVVATGLAWWIGDYRAVLWGLVGQAVTRAVVTHMVAERSFRLGIDRDMFRLIVTFGWPLLANGVIIFTILQGDRLLVGAFYDLEALGGYSAAFALSLVPALVLARINGQLLLPVLSSRQHDHARFTVAYQHSIAIMGTLSAWMMIGFFTVGPQLLVLLYSAKYDDVGLLLAILGAMQAIRLLRTAPSQAALAMGETRNTMYANGARLVGVAVVVALASRQVELEWLAVAGLVAEVVALGVAVRLASRVHDLPAAVTYWPVLRSVAVPLVVLGIVSVTDLGALQLWGVAAGGAVAASLVATGTESRQWLVDQVRRARARRAADVDEEMHS